MTSTSVKISKSICKLLRYFIMSGSTYMSLFIIENLKKKTFWKAISFLLIFSQLESHLHLP